MKYFSLFSGIGGFELGINKAYVEITNRKKDRQSSGDPSENAQKRNRLESAPRKKNGTSAGSILELLDWSDDERAPHCVGYSEIDKYAIQIYEKHFPKHKNYGDITKIDGAILPDFHLLVGGFPCQSFSIAGRRGGFNDIRGTLFFEICRVLREKHPPLLLLENVKGLLSHEQGRTFATILASLDELGYDLQWQVLNSKNHGVPQNRERVYIVGHLRGTSRPEVFPIQGSNSNIDERNKERQERIADTITTRYSSRNGRGTHIRTDEQSAQQKGNQSDDRNRIRRATYSDDSRIRRLTPLECERLQGFPDGWTEGVSDTQRYKCVGNAVTTNVIRDIMKKIL